MKKIYVLLNKEKDFEHTNCSKIVITKQTKHRALVESIIKLSKSFEYSFLTGKKELNASSSVLKGTLASIILNYIPYSASVNVV